MTTPDQEPVVTTTASSPPSGGNPTPATAPPDPSLAGSITTEGVSRPNPAERVEEALFQVRRVLVGQDRMVERVFACLLARGHCLLEGVPGLAKTLTVRTLATVIGGTFTRVQFTADLVPSDLVGTRVYRSARDEFTIEWGPVFTNLLLADEINRAPAKVQSALLEVMGERQVSIGGVTRPVDPPFLVLATQNPIESEGVYPLPEAQRDRFLMKVVVGHPTPAEEMEILRRMDVDPPEAQPVLTRSDLVALQEETDRIFVHHGVADYIVRLVDATRHPERHGLPDLAPLVGLGASPRATLGLAAAGRALALMRGRNHVLPQDVFDVAPEVLRHRLVLSWDALGDNIEPDAILARVLGTVPAPRLSPSGDELA